MNPSNIADHVQLISLGAGVQSSTMALMAAHGEIGPMPTAAIFADTGDEPQSVYDWLDKLIGWLPYPVEIVKAERRDGTTKRLSDEALRLRRTKQDSDAGPAGRLYSRTMIPTHMRHADGKMGRITSRICTVDHKIRPLTKAQRRIAEVKRGQQHVSVQVWIGISTDEADRMKPIAEPWAEARWPLIDLGMSRQDCIDWMKAKGYPEPPRSACVFCPFHSDAEWHRLKTQEPHEFERAVEFERQLQLAKAVSENMTALPHLHSSGIPLHRVDFDPNGKRDDFGNECTGMCGV